MQETDLNILKYKLVLRPIMFSIIGFFVFYSLFHWVCLTYFYDFEFAEEYLKIYFPLIIIVLINLVVFIPSLSLIYINDKHYSLKSNLSEKSDVHPRNWQLKYVTLTLLNIGFILFIMFSQLYVNIKFSKMTEVDKFSDIYTKPPTKYYKSKNYHIEFDEVKHFNYLDATKESKSRVSETYTINENENLFLFPIYNYKSHDTNKEPILGWAYSDTPIIINKMDFKNNDKSESFQISDYFIRLEKSSFLFKKLADLIKLNTNIDHKNLLFEFKNENFEDRTKGHSDYFISLFIIILVLLSLFFKDVVFYSEKIERLQNGESIYKIFLPDFIQKQFKK